LLDIIVKSQPKLTNLSVLNPIGFKHFLQIIIELPPLRRGGLSFLKIQKSLKDTLLEEFSQVSWKQIIW